MFKTCFGGVLQLELSCHTAGGFSSGPLVWVERLTTTRPNPGANYCCHCLWTWPKHTFWPTTNDTNAFFWSLEDSPTPLLEVWGLSLVNPKLFLNICGYITYIHQSDQPWSPLACQVATPMGESCRQINTPWKMYHWYRKSWFGRGQFITNMASLRSLNLCLNFKRSSIWDILDTLDTSWLRDNNKNKGMNWHLGHERKTKLHLAKNHTPPPTGIVLSHA